MTHIDDEVVIDRRFRGPAQSGNGGYVCGVVAECIDGPASIRLLAPIPLDVPLRRTLRGGCVRLEDEERCYVEAHPREEPLDLDVPPPPGMDEIAEAAPHFPDEYRHILPGCFVCGPQRSLPDGLCLFTGNHPARGIAAAAWSPDPSLAGKGGNVDARYLWAALDCPSYFALGAPRPMALLAQLEGRIERQVLPNEALRVMGWSLSHDGRKHRSACALFDADGALVALSRALWITLEKSD